MRFIKIFLRFVLDPKLYLYILIPLILFGTRLRIKKLHVWDAKTDRHILIVAVLYFLFKKKESVYSIETMPPLKIGHNFLDSFD